MTTLEIHLPDEIDQALSQLNRPKEETILSAVKDFLIQEQKVDFASLLKEGYQ